MSDTAYPLAKPTDFDSDIDAVRFAIQQAMTSLQTSLPVKVISVSASGVAPVGFVSIQPLVAMVDGQGNTIDHGIISNVPYFRLQGGSCAVIVDPSPGDIGMAAFSSRDITAVKNSRKAAPPGSWRTHDFSDALYLGGFLNGTPTTYLQITEGGILVHNSTSVKLGDTGGDLRRIIDERFAALFNGHTHGGGPAPAQQITSDHMTTVTKAN
jgi:hypothetical protein